MVWGSWCVCQGGETRRRQMELGILVVSEETLQICQNWQRKRAQLLDASVHYWSSMQFSWPYPWTGFSPFLVCLKTNTISLLSKAGVFYVSLWRLPFLCVWVWLHLSMGWFFVCFGVFFPIRTCDRKKWNSAPSWRDLYLHSWLL